MITQNSDGIRAAYGWLLAYPKFWHEITGRGSETFDEFAADLERDILLNFIVDGEILAVCQARREGDGVYDTHIFTPRGFRQTARAILEFRNYLFEMPEVRRCVFRFPARERSIEVGVALSGAVDTGWRYIEPNGVEYAIFVWNAK